MVEAAAVLDVRDLSQRYGERWIFSRLSFSLPRGALCTLLGPNGTGKSTLLRTLAGLSEPCGGQVRRPPRVGYVPQEVHPALPLSALEMVLLGRAVSVSLLGAPKRHDWAVAEAALQRVEAFHLAARSFSSLSGGERQLVLMARALAAEADLLLLDEPTAAMDWHNQALILRLLAELAAGGITVVVSTHAPQHALEFATHALLMFDAGRQSFGAPADVMDERALSELYRLPVCRVVLPGRPGPGAAVPVFSSTA